jgi:hypothetical protein
MAGGIMDAYYVRNLVKHMHASGAIDAELRRLIDCLDVPETVKDDAKRVLSRREEEKNE